MAFTPTVYFAVAYVAGNVRRMIAPQLDPATVTVKVIYTGNVGTKVPLKSSTLSTGGTNEAHEAFSLTWTKKTATVQTCQLALVPSQFDGLPEPVRNALIDGFNQGGLLTIDVERPGFPGKIDKLAVELRRLKTGEFTVNDDETLAIPAQYPGVTGSNLPTGTGTFQYRAAEIGGNEDIIVDEEGDFTITQPLPPIDCCNIKLTILSSIANVPNGDGANVDLANVPTKLSIDLHLPTETLLLLGRAKTMATKLPPPATTTKWQEATAAANLFARLHGDGLPPLSADGISLKDVHKLAIGRYRSNPQPELLCLPDVGFAPAIPPLVLGPESPAGTGAIGQALVEAKARFTPGKWRRRVLILLTEGRSSQGQPTFPQLLANPSAYLPSVSDDPTNGIRLHAISYTLPGDTSGHVLAGLVSRYGGEFLDTGSEPTPFDPNALREMLLSVLTSIIPAERAELHDSAATLEDGLDRAIFVTTGENIAAQHADPASAALPGGRTAPGGSVNGFTWAVVDRPIAGAWTFAATAGARSFVLYDVALRLRINVEAAGLGAPIRLTARLLHRGAPVVGAKVVVAVHRPEESVGVVTTDFVRGGGLVSAVRQGKLDVDALGASLGEALPASSRRTFVEPPKDELGEEIELRRRLIDAAAVHRNLELQTRATSLELEELEPGYYVGSLPASDVVDEGTYSFRFRATGKTPTGYAFVRDARGSRALTPVPSPEHSETSITKTPLPDNKTRWTFTALPRTATGRPLGPGLAEELSFEFLRGPDGAPPLLTVDRLDATYSASVDLDASRTTGPVALRYLPAGDSAPPVVINDGPGTKRVKVTLDKIQVLDDKDPCLGRGELVFDAIVAPNGTPHRAIRTRVPAEGVLQLSSGEGCEVRRVLFEGLVEEDATLAVTVGGTELDYIFFFEHKEELARYHRVISLERGKRELGPDDEAHDPEALADWRLWYTVEVD